MHRCFLHCDSTRDRMEWGRHTNCYQLSDWTDEFDNRSRSVRGVRHKTLTMLSKIRSQKVSNDQGRSGKDKAISSASGSGIVHTAMQFSNQLRTEWVVTNPGANEEKVEPWLYDGVANKREKLNSYNMQRLPHEPYNTKEGDCCELRASKWCEDPLTLFWQASSSRQTKRRAAGRSAIASCAAD